MENLQPTLRTYKIDCRKVQDFQDFVEAFNKGLIEACGGFWNGNLDAFNDYLSWPEEGSYQLTILGSDQCAKSLSYKASAAQQKELWTTLVEILLDNRDHVHVLFK